MLPYAEVIETTLKALYRHSLTPVRSALLAELLAVPIRTVKWYLRKLELAGRVIRRTPRGGYLPQLVGAGEVL